MEILSPLIIIFLCVSTIVLCFVSFFILEREYAKRHLPHLRMFAQSQFWEGMALLSLFVGQAMTLRGDTRFAAYFIDPVQGIAINLAAAATILGVLHFMKPGRLRTALSWLVAVPFVTSVWCVVTTPPTVFVLDGFPVSGLTFLEFFTNLSTLVVEWLLLIGVGVYAVIGRLFLKKPKQPHLTAMSYAGVLGFLLIFVYIGVVAGLLSPQLLGVTYVLVPLLMASLFAGAVSFRHENPAVAANPWRIYSSSILVKIGLMNVAVFLLSGFVLIGGISMSYNGTVRASRDAAMRNLVDYEASAQDNVERETLALVQAMSVRIGAERLHDDPEPARLEVIRRTVAQAAAQLPGISFVGIVSSDGTVTEIFGVQDRFDIAAHPAIATALQGRAGADVLAAPDGVARETVSASPILDDGVPVSAVFSVTRSVPQPASTAEDSRVPAYVHRGVIGADRRVITGFGEDTKSAAITADVFGRIGPGKVTTVTLSTGETVFARRTLHSGVIHFAFLSKEEAQKSTLAIIFVAVVIAMCISALMAAFQMYSIGAILSPVRRLVGAARRMEANDLTARAAYSSLDEIGSLATAFDAMADTIEKRTARLNGLLRQQKDFLVNAADDLRNPLNHFRWGLETMRFGEAGKLTPEQHAIAEQMYVTSLHLEQTLQNISDTERLSDGKLALSLEPTDVAGIVDDVAGEYAVRMHENRIDFAWTPPSDLPRAMADVVHLRRVLGCIIDNAVKYTDPGGRIAVTAKTMLEGDARFVTVSVSDTGRGIPPNDKPFIFTKFFRASNVARQDIEGTGLGLYICKKLIALHGGRLWFVSDLGKGSTFSFTVPVATGAGAASSSS